MKPCVRDQEIEEIRQDQHPEIELERAIWQIFRESLENIIYQTAGDRTDFVLTIATESGIKVVKNRCGFIYFSALDFLRRRVSQADLSASSDIEDVMKKITVPGSCLNGNELKLAAICYSRLVGILRIYWRDSNLAKKILSGGKGGKQ